MKVEQLSFYGRKYAVFHIPITNGTVFMKQQIHLSEKNAFYIVYVDRMRFESVWFKGNSQVAPELARGNENAWRNDYKFHLAEKGFSHGITNPVSLAKLQSNTRYPKISFIDGITRTVWLMANGAKEFPVFSYDIDNAHRLHDYIGVRNAPFVSNNDLFLHFQKRGLGSAM
ncbi:hypothetical protein SO574_23555 (plasmid) [Vibrio alfacsensis]|uniref:plasmid fertility inhibition factor family protein n=1 Tax=Vibrio alfacsensis TaxID=1074311 RepID=UPI002ADE57DC|nr:hypothetical protein [Vibrio alfacsensis]WQE79451.1 hypothetical protein SO574_23555 [Vibrio alfacsensis]